MLQVILVFSFLNIPTSYMLNAADKDECRKKLRNFVFV